jgi:hypothetical protein
MSDFHSYELDYHLHSNSEFIINLLKYIIHINNV